MSSAMLKPCRYFSPSLRKPDLAFLPKRAYWGVAFSAEKKFSGPQLRKFQHSKSFSPLVH